MNNKLNKLFPAAADLGAARAAAPEGMAADSPLLFLGFIASIFWVGPYEFIANPTLTLYWIEDAENPGHPLQVTLGWLLFTAGSMTCVALHWRQWYLRTGDIVCNWMFACYLFAIYEMLIVWDKPWFKFLYIPMTSQTLIFFGFAYAYIRNNWSGYR